MLGQQGQVPRLAWEEAGIMCCSPPSGPRTLLPWERTDAFLRISLDLHSLKTKTFFLVSDLSLPCSQHVSTQSNCLAFPSSFLFFQATEHVMKTTSYTKPRSM